MLSDCLERENTKVTFNGDEYICKNRETLILNLERNWESVNFTDIKLGDTVRLKDPDGTFVTHKDGRSTFIAKSDVHQDELGLLCFNI